MKAKAISPPLSVKEKKRFLHLPTFERLNMPRHGSPNKHISGAQDYLPVPDELADVLLDAIDANADLLLDILEGRDKPTPLLDDILNGGKSVSGKRGNPFRPTVVSAAQIAAALAGNLSQPDSPSQNTGSWVQTSTCAPPTGPAYTYQTVTGSACRNTLVGPKAQPWPIQASYANSWIGLVFPSVLPDGATPIQFISQEQGTTTTSPTLDRLQGLSQWQNTSWPARATTGLSIGGSMSFEPNPNMERERKRVPPKWRRYDIPRSRKKKELPRLGLPIIPPGLIHRTVIEPQPANKPQVRPQPQPLPEKHWPRPPLVREKERKVIHWGVKVWKLVDLVSESAEVVDAFYEALPKEVRRKWEKKYGGFWTKDENGKYKWVLPSRGLADQAGQYGIDYADMKLQALWYNWDKVNIGDALANVAYNQIEDKIIGNIMRKVPKMTGQTANGAFEAYGQVAGDLKSTFKDYVLVGR